MNLLHLGPPLMKFFNAIFTAATKPGDQAAHDAVWTNLSDRSSFSSSLGLFLAFNPSNSFISSNEVHRVVGLVRTCPVAPCSNFTLWRLYFLSNSWISGHPSPPCPPRSPLGPLGAPRGMLALLHPPSSPPSPQRVLTF